MQKILQEFDRLDKETVPEIMRCSISTVILQMLSIGITNVSKFDFLDPPPQDAVEGALRQLHLLGNISIYFPYLLKFRKKSGELIKRYVIFRCY